jgi:hypothetical protein
MHSPESDLVGFSERDVPLQLVEQRLSHNALTLNIFWLKFALPEGEGLSKSVEISPAGPRKAALP